VVLEGLLVIDARAACREKTLMMPTRMITLIAAAMTKRNVPETDVPMSPV